MIRRLRKIGRVPPVIVTKELTDHITRAGVDLPVVRTPPANVGDMLSPGERVVAVTDNYRYVGVEFGDGTRARYPVDRLSTRRIETQRADRTWDGATRIRKRAYREYTDHDGNLQLMMIEQSWEYQR